MSTYMIRSSCNLILIHYLIKSLIGDFHSLVSLIVVVWLVRKCFFMQPEDSLLYLKLPAIWPYSEPAQSIHKAHILIN